METIGYLKNWIFTFILSKKYYTLNHASWFLYVWIHLNYQRIKVIGFAILWIHGGLDWNGFSWKCIFQTIKTTRHWIQVIFPRYRINDLQFIWINGFLDTIFICKNALCWISSSLTCWIRGLVDIITNHLLVHDIV